MITNIGSDTSVKSFSPEKIVSGRYCTLPQPSNMTMNDSATAPNPKRNRQAGCQHPQHCEEHQQAPIVHRTS